MSIGDLSDEEEEIYQTYLSEYRQMFGGEFEWEQGNDVHRQAMVVARVINKFLEPDLDDEPERDFVEEKAAQTVLEMEESEDLEFTSDLARGP